MVRNYMRLGAVALLLCALTLPTMALAGVSYSTFPADGSNGASCIGQNRSNAVGIQIPAGSDYTLNTIAMRFYGTNIEQTPFSLDVYDDNAGVPGSTVGALI